MSSSQPLPRARTILPDKLAVRDEFRMDIVSEDDEEIKFEDLPNEMLFKVGHVDLISFPSDNWLSTLFQPLKNTLEPKS